MKNSELKYGRKVGLTSDMMDFTSKVTGLDFQRDFVVDDASLAVKDVDVTYKYRNTVLELLDYIFFDKFTQNDEIIFNCNIENIKIDNPALLALAFKYLRQSINTCIKIEDLLLGSNDKSIVLNVTIKDCVFLFSKGVCSLDIDFTDLLFQNEIKYIKSISIHISNSELYHFKIKGANELKFTNTKGTLYFTVNDNPKLCNIVATKSDLVLVSDLLFTSSQHISSFYQAAATAPNSIYAVHRNRSREASVVQSYIEDPKNSLEIYRELASHRSVYYVPTIDKVTFSSQSSSLLLMNTDVGLMLSSSGDNELITPALYKQFNDYDLFPTAS